ncbi:unnamed protein product, partial [marine sediment metagenome]
PKNYGGYTEECIELTFLYEIRYVSAFNCKRFHL